MLKRLTAGLLLLLCLCSTALAAGNEIRMTKVERAGLAATDWFVTPESRARLIDLTAEQLSSDSSFSRAYSGFRIADARENACAGMGDDGQLFVAMYNAKTDALLLVSFNPETFVGAYTVKGGARELYAHYQVLAGSTKLDPIAQMQSLKEMYALADEVLTVSEPTLLRRFDEDRRNAGTSWLDDGASMATLAVVTHYQFMRTVREGLMADFDSANALEICYLLERASAPETLTLACLDDEHRMLLLTEYDMEAQALTCRLFSGVHQVYLPRFTDLYDRAHLVDPTDVLMAMIDVNVALAEEP